MAIIKCIVQGDRTAAERAAAERGIPFTFRFSAGPTITHGTVPAEYADAVKEWFDASSWQNLSPGDLLTWIKPD